MNKIFSSIIKRNLTTITNTNANGPIQNSILKKINNEFGPYNLMHLEVNNVSWKHNVPKGSETHFEVIVVSDKFDSLSRVKRHEKLNELLSAELKSQNVSISFTLLEPTRWYNSIRRGLKLTEIYQSPPCLGGRAKEFAEENFKNIKK